MSRPIDGRRVQDGTVGRYRGHQSNGNCFGKQYANIPKPAKTVSSRARSDNVSMTWSSGKQNH